LKGKVAALVEETEITAVGIRRADHRDTFYLQKLALTWPTSGGRSVGIVCSRTKATELLLLFLEFALNNQLTKPNYCTHLQIKKTVGIDFVISL
jgi:hypothetical protein